VQEAAVVAMADGYARATGRPAFVNLHVAAGTANGLIGMLNARRSRTPLVVVAGQQDQRHLLQDPMLSGDLVALASGVAKHAQEVHRPQDLPVVLRRAFALAQRPPQRPVFVSVPMNVLDDDTPVEVPARSPMVPPGAAAGLDRAAALLAAADRPAIIAGDGVGRDGAVGALVRVAEALGAVTYHQPMNDCLDFPGSHPLYAGPRYVGLDLGELDWRLAAQFFGVPAGRVRDTEELGEAVATVAALEGPLLVEVPLRGHR
jgi:benzoylformate decarboxylase